MRDNMRMRRLVKSDWYQSLWPIALAPDQDAKLKFENAATGFRAAVAATAMTGHRGDRVLYDDPHSVEGALSDVQRAPCRGCSQARQPILSSIPSLPIVPRTRSHDA